MACTLSGEYAVWMTQLGFTLDELHAINLDSLEASFLPGEEVARVRAAHFGAGGAWEQALGISQKEGEGA